MLACVQENSSLLFRDWNMRMFEYCRLYAIMRIGLVWLSWFIVVIYSMATWSSVCTVPIVCGSRIDRSAPQWSTFSHACSFFNYLFCFRVKFNVYRRIFMSAICMSNGTGNDRECRQWQPCFPGLHDQSLRLIIDDAVRCGSSTTRHFNRMTVSISAYQQVLCYCSLRVEVGHSCRSALSTSRSSVNADGVIPR